MKLASHNSMTYLPVARWWMRLFAPFAKCQDKTVEEQYASGVRYFDLRVAFDNNERPQFAHGKIRYKGSPFAVLATLNNIADVYVRVTLESQNADDTQLRCFIAFCWTAVKLCKDIKFAGGYRKCDWKQLYDFDNPEPSICEYYQSYHDGKPHLGWFPRLWAWRNNPETEKDRKWLSGADEFLMLDFI